MQGSTTISSTLLVACYHSTEQKLATAQQQTVGKKRTLIKNQIKRYSDDARKTEHRKMDENPKPGTQNMTQNNL